MRIAALIASRNRPDLVERAVAQLGRMTTHTIDAYVVECGSELEHVSPHSTLWYPDDEFRGKCYGHGLALAQAQQTADYDYFWVLMNDVFFEEGVDAAAVLVEQLEREPRMAILSPTNAEGGYPGAAQRPGGDWRAVTTCDYLGFMLRAEALREAGFLDAHFSYCWGAIHELSYRLYSAGWFVAYSDRVAYHHLGGSTYGVPGTRTISRDEYQRRAKRYAYDWFRERHGERWHERFLAATSAHAIEFDTFAEHREFWLTGFEPGESAARLAAWSAACEPGADAASRNLVLAWPDWTAGGTELEQLFERFGPSLQARPEVGLALFCHARECDRATALGALEQAYERTLGSRPGPDLDVELVLGPLTPELHRTLVDATRAVLELPSLAARGEEALPGVHAPRVHDAVQLSAALGAPRTTGS